MNKLLGKFKKAPLWQQRFLAILFISGTVIATLLTTDFAKKHLSDSPQAREVKSALVPIADQLAAAEKLGDQAVAIDLMEPITKILNDYNDADEQIKTQINGSPLRYCLLAATHLSTGITNFYQSGYWQNKEQYKAALDACR
jgi:hypothetical protein